MGNYYAIIDGKRYNASLINNAAFRTRGQGDGRISEQDAQELWRIALDGGRVTEIEEDTIEYLLANFKWTDAAEAWLKEEMSTEVAKIKSYYKIIDGLRYDRKILEEADRRVAGQGDGRISVDDAEMLLPLFGDFGDVTIVEERTLWYLMEHYNWTMEAEKWFLEKVNRISKQSSVEPLLLHIMQTEFGFQRLPFAYFKTEAVQQMLDHENAVSLPDALRAAINSLLNDTTDKSFASIGYSSDPLKEFLEGGRLVLLPGDMASEPSLSSFPAPANGESIRENWLFGLELFDLTDDVYWIVVPRSGDKAAYNYIGGPNVGHSFHTVEKDTYFTIVVKSCDVPYPGITVDVQDPTGKYIVGKSDAEGKVLIEGPAGTYSIYASDGWSAQSKTFQWDGQGKDQVRNVVLDC
ncbi:MAG: hypothetical protein AAGM67_09135 [Bacteroidota bacterium]